jgi:hypothetical protein
MKRGLLVGWVLIVAGVVQMLFAADMTVSLPESPDVANMDLVAQRLLMFLGGGFAFLAGVAWVGVTHIVRAIAKPVAS